MSSIAIEQANTAGTVVVDAWQDGNTWVAECGEMRGWTGVADSWDEIVLLAMKAADVFAEEFPLIRARGVAVVRRESSPFVSGQRNS